MGMDSRVRTMEVEMLLNDWFRSTEFLDFVETC